MTDVSADPPSAGPSKPAEPTRRSAAIFVAGGIFLSRIAGLIRESVFAHFLGTSPAASAFKAAFRIPNFLQNLFGEGVLSASFIPVYSRLLAEGDKKLADRVAGVVAAVLSVAVTLIVLLGIALAPLLVDLIAPGFEGEIRLLTIRIVRVLFPGIGLLVLSAWCLGVLNSHRRFFIPYVAPVLWSAAMIGTLLFFGPRLEVDALAVALAWGTVAGCALQLGIQVPFVFKHAPEIRFAFQTSLDPVRQVFRNLAPVVVSRGVVQISAFIDEAIASLLGSAAIASLAFAQTIYLLPISLFGMSVAASELPQMSGLLGAEEERFAKLRERLGRGLRQIAFFVVPSVVAFLTIGNVLVAALFQSGKFGPDDTRYVWYLLIGSTVGLLAATLGRLYSSTFYAMGDTRTPLRFALVRVALTATLGYLFAIPLRSLVVAFLYRMGVPIPNVAGGEAALGAIGLTFASGLAGCVEYLLLRRGLARKLGFVGLPSSFLGKVWGSATLAGLLALFVRVAGKGWIEALARLSHPFVPAIVVAGVFGVAYFALTAVFGIAESRATIKRVLGS